MKTSSSPSPAGRAHLSLDDPAAAGFRVPAEWAPHEAVWSAWPYHGELWGAHLASAQEEFVQLCRAIAAPQGSSGAASERLEILIHNEAAGRQAEERLTGLGARFHEVPYGDIWLRDTAPIFTLGEALNGPGELATLCFEWNGWGEKYLFPEDKEVNRRISQMIDARAFTPGWVLEGGAIEVDGEGTVLTTVQCLRNRNRGRFEHTVSQIEADLRSALGVERVLWLERGLLNDHTDGHIDTLARFVAPGVVVCMEPRVAGDPNRDVLIEIRKSLAAFRDAQGRRLEVFVVPSPGLVVDGDGRPMPASYVNFYIANRSVVVPTYGSRFDEEALYRLEGLFPTRQVVGAVARSILEGGGAFHCITQQQPEVKT